MNIVSRETAQKLKDAGFPQPEPEEAQFWHKCNGDTVVILDTYINSEGRQIEIIALYETTVYKRQDMEGFIFAPSASDILRELNDHCLFKDTNTCGGFVCYKLGKMPYGYHCHENPADAAASAWLSIHSQTEIKSN